MSVAKVLKWWIEKIAQSADVFMSDDDIALGTRWTERIKAELAETRIGVICVTPENQQAPWINFEAGAISKAVDGNDNKVVPILIDFQRKADYKGPLAEFNLALLNREGLLKLAKSIHNSLPNPKSEADVEETFEAWWAGLQERLENVQSVASDGPPPTRSLDEVAADILDIVRDLQKQDNARASARWLSTFMSIPGAGFGRKDVQPSDITLSGQIEAYLGGVGVSATAVPIEHRIMAVLPAEGAIPFLHQEMIMKMCEEAPWGPVFVNFMSRQDRKGNT